MVGPSLLRIAAFARVMGVSVTTVGRRIARGILRPAAVTRGGHRLFRREDAGLLRRPRGKRYRR